MISATGYGATKKTIPLPSYVNPPPSPVYTRDPDTGLQTRNIGGTTYLNPNDPALKKKLAQLNPSGTSDFGAIFAANNFNPNSFDPTPTTTTPNDNPDPKNTIDIQPYINDLYAQRDQALALHRNQDLAARKRLLLGFGSKTLAQSILGQNDPFNDTISDAPTGTSFLSQRNYKLGQDTLAANNDASVNNTYFGGGRLFALNQLNQGYQTDVGTQLQSVKDQLGGIDTGYANFAQDWETQIANAKRDLALKLMGAVV